MPDHALRYVNVYVFEQAHGVVLVDTGLPRDDAMQSLREGLRSCGVELSDVTGVLVTHMHRDHYGLAPRVREESGAWIALHPDDADRLRRSSTDEVMAARRKWLRCAGAPEAHMAALCGAPEELKWLKDQGLPDRLVRDGERVLEGRWDLRAMWTPGHTPGHLCFRELGLGVLLSGDHLLPRITPNVSAGPFTRDNPLSDYEKSLTAVGAIADDVNEVWPAHEYRFSNARARVGSLLDHHAQRVSEVRRCLRDYEPRTTWEVAERLTWSRSWEQTLGSYRRSALGETEAHLRLLVSIGEAELRGGGTSAPQRWVRLAR